ncbi:sialate O-acetylesterase [Dyadobacter sandarakinus]|uniref:T9SS type A sorting domain-containing protein n=1 Tax=Dyadobacter sandarakinus TaxID=2747268 RepID=A0ABX7ICB0_9BACT|nr:sialate O-acetylesterase [Dyadobacter sandarakinus]QRR02571.1 T9SS type A sorting domain-containing protein [Dyadobacter sandarakinus]
MKHYLPYCFWVVLSLTSLELFGQISVDYPSDRAVFQRDKNNSATIYIAGSYTKVVDKIEAKLNALNEGNSTGWITISDNPSGGLYSGSIDAAGGWYSLEVRGMKGGQVVASGQVGHVGIGEVFMIAGQSNGQGYYGYGGPGAQDDRVNTIDYNNVDPPYQNDELPYPQFIHVNADSKISPRGKSAWCWGKLGDLLASRLKVPILFYNVAWYGTAVRAWRESINGIGYSVYSGVPIEPFGMPYNNLRMVLQRYTPITGLRGILWLQGEADNFTNTSPDSYAADLQAVIEAGRNESGKQIAWMVSLTSYDNLHGSDAGVLDGQRKVIRNVPAVFEGPNTDQIQIPRVDGDEGVHFRDYGLTQLGEAWNAKLNDQFFNNSEPYKGMSPLRVTSVCIGNGNIALNAGSGGLGSYQWTNGQTSSNIEVSNGTYRVSARDGRGNYIFSPEIRINDRILPDQPTISLQGSNPVCLGNTATLIASTSENVTWNTGSTNTDLQVTSGGDYFVTTRNAYGCQATSAKMSIQVLTSPLPEKPTIVASGAVTFCEGGQVSLQSNAQVTSIWSNGENNASIIVRNSGDYRVRAKDNLGCFSPESDPITVKVNPLPAKPVVSLNGPAIFCAGGIVTLTSNYQSGNIWSTEATSASIAVTQSGSFSLRQRDINGCESTSDPVSIQVNPLPAMPTISALRPTTFCERDYTTLRSSEAYVYLWSNGYNGREMEIRQTGDYTLSVRDQNGCVSPASPTVKVVANPLPPTPTISAEGPLVFCADLSVNLNASPAAGFLWSNGAATQTLKVTNAGTFSVQTINEFQCFSDPSNKITTQTLPLPPSPTVQALGVTTFCDGDLVILKADKGSYFYWNNGAEGDTIHVAQSGAYAAKVQDDKGCFSPYSKTIAVDVKPAPTVPVVRQTGAYTLVSENNLEAGTYTWKYNGAALTETSATIKAIRSGAYSVSNTIVYSPTLTCLSEFSKPYYFNADSHNPGFVTHPNPVISGDITIETVQDIPNAEILIIDSHGVIRKTFKIKKFDKAYTFDLSGISSGLYVIQLRSTALTASQKLVIAR